jgi:hyperosmotically inducible protein
MLKRLMVSAAVLALTGSAAIAGSIEPRKDFQVFKDVAATVDRYTQFTIFDDVSASVKDGVVTLTGKVTMPYKRSDIEKRVAKVNGVVSVRDQISVLPVSQFDDELRYRIARSIYGNSNFWNYAIMANPPIHIVVERGRVTLTGRSRHGSRPDAGAIARHAVRRLVRDERAEDRRGNARVA